MDLIKNYYGILGITKTSTEKEIKKAYYKLSFTHHPDKGGDAVIFGEMTEAYDILSSEQRSDYDKRSKWGSNYDESTELLDFEFSNNAKGWDESKLEEWVNQNQLNILIYIDDKFDGHIEYERWVTCKTCGGDGKDTTSKIEIKDENGNVLRLFDGSDGCDFCEGSGKDWNGNPCYFCGGKGKVGFTDCKKCNGEKRILGKQKLKGIKFPSDEKAHKIEAMGHVSKEEKGKVGCVWLIKKN
jgi:DnaJ-class molecular chaperone